MVIANTTRRDPLKYVQTWSHPHNRKYITYFIVARGDRATAPDNMYRTFCEVRTCGFWDMRADRQMGKQTDGQTYRHADRNTRLYRRRSNNGLSCCRSAPRQKRCSRLCDFMRRVIKPGTCQHLNSLYEPDAELSCYHSCAMNGESLA